MFLEASLFFGVIFLLWFLGNNNVWRLSVNENYPRILMYHSVDSKEKASGLNIQGDKFREEMNLLKDSGYHFFKVSDLVSQKGEHRKVAITLDDGFRNNYLEVFPIIKELDIPITIYLAPDFLDEEERLTEEQILEMDASGLVEFGAHTMTHVNLNKVSDNVAFKEIKSSKVFVENLLKKDCLSFSYPYGAYSRNHMGMVKKLGFKNAVTVKKSIVSINSENTYKLPRMNSDGRKTMFQFSILLSKGRYKL